MCDKQTRFRRIINPLCRIDQLANLKHSGPHGTSPASNGRIPIPIIEHLVRHERATEPEEAELHAADVEAARGGFVNDGQVFDGVLARADLFEDEDVFARADDGEHGHLEFDLAGEEEREFGEHGDVHGGADGGGRVFV